jgi:hypothetical protein
MSDGVTITTNAQRLLRDWSRLAPGVKAGVRRGLLRGLLLTEEAVRTGAGVKLRRESGLAGRLTSYAAPLGDTLEGAIGFRKTRGFPYELSQEFGATAKPGKAMAMPVSPKARRHAEQGGTARAFPAPLFIPAGTHVLAEAGGRKWANQHGRSGGGEFVTHYVLIKRLKPRLGFRKNVIASLPTISAEVESGGREGVRQA